MFESVNACRVYLLLTPSIGVVYLEPLFLYKDASLHVLGRELRPKLNATFVDLLDISSGLGWTADQL